MGMDEDGGTRLAIRESPTLVRVSRELQWQREKLQLMMDKAGGMKTRFQNRVQNIQVWCLYTNHEWSVFICDTRQSLAQPSCWVWWG